MGAKLIGSYSLRVLAEFRRNRNICGSVLVAQRARKYRRQDMRIPPNRVLSKLSTPAPIIRAKKNSFRSAPKIVRGRLSVRNTGLVRVWCMLDGGKEPSHEIDRADRHTDAEDHAGEGPLSAPFAECKH